MKFVLLMWVLVVAACTGKNAGSTSHSAASSWPTKWCQAQPGISKEQLVTIMGPPTTALPTQLAWSNEHYSFYAFLEDDGTVRQLDINQSSLTAAEKAGLQCEDVRTRRSMSARASRPVREIPPACDLVSQAQMSAILGAAVVAHPTGRSKCIYKSETAQGPYVEFSVDRGDGAAAMAGAGFAGKHEPGLASPYDGIGDQAVAVGPALLIRTGDDLVTLVFSGVEDAPGAAKKIFDAAKAGM